MKSTLSALVLAFALLTLLLLTSNQSLQANQEPRKAPRPHEPRKQVSSLGRAGTYRTADGVKAPGKKIHSMPTIERESTQNSNSVATTLPPNCYDGFSLDPDNAFYMCDCIDGRYFIRGFPAKTQYKVDRKFAPPINEYGVRIDIGEDSKWGTSTTFDIGTDLIYSPFGWPNIVQSTVYGGFDPSDLGWYVYGYEPPLWLPTGVEFKGKLVGSCSTPNSTAVLTYSTKYKWPDPKDTEKPEFETITIWKRVPFLGGKKFGISKFETEVELEASPSKSDLKTTVSGGTNLEVASTPLGVKMKGDSTTRFTSAGIKVEEVSVTLEASGGIPKFDESLIKLMCGVACEAGGFEDNPYIGGIVSDFYNSAKIKAEITPKFSGAARFKSIADKLEWVTSEIAAEFETKLALILNPMSLDSLSVEGSGKGNMGSAWQYPAVNDSFLKSVYTNFLTNVKFQVLNFSCSASNTFSWDYPSGSSGANPSTSECVFKIPEQQPQFLGSEWQSADAAQRQRLGASGFVPNQEIVVVSDVYPQTGPALWGETSGQDGLLLWTDSDPALPAEKSFEIRYSFFDELSGWGTPQPLTADLLLDFSPMVAEDGSGQFVAVWQRNKTEQDASVALDAAYMNAFEIAFSVYDPVSGWTPAGFLTANSALDIPIALERDSSGNLLLVWRQNSAGQIMGNTTNPDSLYFAIWDGSSWSSPQLVQSGLASMSQVAAARHDANKMQIVYGRDTDGDLVTVSDKELFQLLWDGSSWGAAVQLTNDTVPDRSPRLVYDSAGLPRLFWLKEDNLQTLQGDFSGTPQLVASEDKDVQPDYQSFQDAQGNITLLWQGLSEEGVDTFYTAYDAQNNSFSEALQLTHDEPLEKFLTPATNADGDLMLAFKKTALISETVPISPTLVMTDVVSFGQTDLNFLVHTFGTDLSLESGDLAVQPEKPAINSTAEFTATLRNLGDRAVVSPSLDLFWEDPADGSLIPIDTITLPNPIAGGSTAEAAIQWQVPGETGDYRIVAVADLPDSSKEWDLTNQSAEMIVQVVEPFDDFDTALPVATLSFTDTLDVQTATTVADDPILPCGPDSQGYGSVWYAYTPDQDSSIIADTFGSDYDTVLAIWRGSRGNLVNVACNDDTNGNQSQVANVGFTAGETYYFEITGQRFSDTPSDIPGYSEMPGNLVLNIEPVVGGGLPNDAFGSATPITTAPFGDGLDVRLATTAVDDPVLPCGPGDQGNGSVWYALTPGEDVFLTIDTFGSDYDSALAVWQGTSGNLSNVACNDDGVDFQAQIVDAPLIAGETYYIEVVGSTGYSGNLTLNVVTGTGGHITGTVTAEADGAPLVGIEACANTYDDFGYWMDEICAATDANGSYDIGGLPGGDYYMVFYDLYGDYVAEWYDDLDYRDSFYVVSATSTTTVSGIDAALAEAGHISGTVTAEADGASLYDISACAYFHDGYSWQGRCYGTDSSGYYNIGGLAAGVYKVEFNDDWNGNYDTEYYDNAPDLDNADDVFVTAGSTSSGIDAALVAAQITTTHNDDIDDAAQIANFPYTDSQYGMSATTAFDDPTLPCGPGNQGIGSVWYALTPAQDGLLTADTFGSSYDTVLAVWQGTRGSLSSIDCNDDAGTIQSQVIDVPLTAGLTYYVEVTSYCCSGTHLGDLVFNLSFSGANPSVIQNISLESGWNMISTYVEPDIPAIDTTLSAIESDVVLVKNGAGEVYWPSMGINDIGTWSTLEGYQIFMLNPHTLSVSGTPVDPAQTPINLPDGWSLVPYLRDAPLLMAQAINSVNGQLVIAKNGLGEVYWPAYGINQIGDMQPGKGYQLNLDSAGTLTYPDNN